jgi:hypothetical protein
LIDDEDLEFIEEIENGLEEDELWN